MIDAQVVVEQLRDLPLEDVELRERVLADRDEEVDAKVGLVHSLDECAREAPLVALAAVIEEVLLELVEDDEDLSVDLLGRAPEVIGE